MTRPAIVIGLGGTGQWVLTFLKKELLEIGHGVMPKEVKLISFDTTSQTAANIGQGGGREDDKAIRAGAVELTLGKEFIPIGDQVGPLVSEIAQGKHSHLQWFPAQPFLSKLAPASFNVKEGSGQIRQMGRIAIFYDLSDFAKSKILSHIGAAMKDLKGIVNKDVQLEIIIVGSLAGGTGAGMMVDIALLTRAQAAQLVGGNHIVRGFFVLPKAFTSGGLGESRDMLARSFAAWRELDRFMIVSERFGPRKMIYSENNKDLQINLDKRAYDVSYMIDPARNTENTLENVKPEDGIFPAISHCLSAFLDKKAGKAYTEFVVANLAGRLAQLPRKPYHSAIGSYTLKVPIYYAEEKFSHQLALDVLREFLKPEINNKGRVTRVSELYNKEVNQGEVGPAVLAFMASSALNLSGNEIPNTKFLPLVADIKAHEAQRENSIVQQVARGGLTVGNSRYLMAMTDISQDDEGKLILRNITDELQRPIWTDVAPSQQAGDTPDAAYTRIKNKVPQVRQEHYGVDMASGERLRGKYGTALEHAQAAQVFRYKKLLAAWTLHTLNGESPDPLIARAGKIGYVRAFYAELVDNFTYFVGFLNKVRQTRNEELRLAARTKEGANRSLMEYNRLRGKKGWFTFWDDFTHPDAHRAQRNYLLAEQRDIDVRKDDILLDVLAETANEMKGIAEKTLAEVDNWIAHLATGDQSIKSLYQEAVESLANVNVNHELDKRLDKISKLVGEHEYQSIPKNVSDAIKCLVWKVDEMADPMKIICGVEMPSEDPNQAPVFQSFRRTEENPVKFNLEMILNLAQKPYTVLKQDKPLAREIQKVYPTGKNLAETVAWLAEPMYQTSVSRQGAKVVACYTRVASNIDEETTKYFGDFTEEMKARRPDILKSGVLELVDSEDLYKMTIVRSDDLVPSSDFQMWHQCREAYIQKVTDPHDNTPAKELHIFPAEINACYYEKEMPALLGRNYRTLSPEVVALLEDREKFRMFFLASALGFIKTEYENGQPYRAFKLPKDKESLFITLPSGSLDSTKEDIFQVIHNFVMEGCDQRQGMGQNRFVDWKKLLETIRASQRDLGKTKATKLYQQQIDDPKGIIKSLQADVESWRSQEKDEKMRETIGQEYIDLAEVATVIYLDAIKAIHEMENQTK